MSPSAQPTASAASFAVGVPAENSSIRASAPDSSRNVATRRTGSGQSDTIGTVPGRCV